MNIPYKISRSPYLLVVIIILASCKADKNSVIPEVETKVITDISHTTAMSGGSILSDGGGVITEKGVCWSTSGNPTIMDSHTSNGNGDDPFESTIDGLLPSTEYYVRAFAVNNAGIAYGNERSFTTLSQTSYGQIIADHTVVEKFDDIPEAYLNEVKKMWLVIPGESHSRGYFNGLTLLEALFPAYSVNWTESGIPEAYTTSHLRTSRATWGDVDNSSGWIYSYGEEDWWTSASAIARTKAGITYCNTHNLNISAFGFGWCYDPDININEYLNTTQEYIDFCTANGYFTKVFFTTGPVEGTAGRNCYNYYRWPEVRSYVAADPSRILFDYADILCYNDDGTPTTKTCNGVTTPAITTTNWEPTEYYHISEAGATRLAKAMWWMLARMAGWDGN